jgi:hypothetical protein
VPVVVTKIAVKDFNPSLLREQLRAGQSVLDKVGWPGFVTSTPRLFQPIPRSRRVGFTEHGMVDIAQPGEIRFYTTREISLAEEAFLDGVLAGHDAAQLSAEQQREELDRTDLLEILQTGQDQYIADVQALTAIFDGWDAADVATRQLMTKQAIGRLARDLTILGKIMRYVIRKELKAAV